MRKVAYDKRAILIDGKRTMLVSGAIHYTRSTPGMWPSLMKRSREAGLNCVETYVFWNLHERTRGVYDFSGRLDLRRYCEAAKAEDLNVILRIGPYICAETNFGGLPPWLRDVPGMKIRTLNKPFMDEMERWMRALVEHLRSYFAREGGPIILAQVENEYRNIGKAYGKDGETYCKWAVDLGLSLDLGVPWVMCAGSAPGSIETINGFLAHYRLEKHFAEHQGQPAIWTENWPSWYDTWGYAHHTRSAQHVAYGVARFFAGGGSGVNYYMWHGGTNFGREAMYLQTTSYGFDAPLDEYGLETGKSRHLSLLHSVLLEAAEILFAQDAPKVQALAEKASAFSYDGKAGSIAFLCNDGEASCSVSYEGRSYELKPASALVLRDGKLVFDTASPETSKPLKRSMRSVSSGLASFESCVEPLPDLWPAACAGSAVEAAAPVEQLSLTHDSTDYCWYSTALKVGGKGLQKGVLNFDGAGDLLYVYVDGKLVASTVPPLLENRTLEGNKDFTQAFELSLKPGVRKLQVLACAVGLIKGDWMLGYQNMVNERKGIWGTVSWNGTPLRSRWTMQPGLIGERSHLFEPEACPSLWNPSAKLKSPGLRWWRASFPLPKGDDPLVLDLSSMGKGLLWVNGVCLGRYWLAPGVLRNPISPRDVFVETASDGSPTQSLYHVPREHLKERNSLVLFEEQGGDLSDVRLLLRK